MLGVFIGVGALIIMLGVGKGAIAAVSKQIESLGTSVVVVLPGALTSGAYAAVLEAPSIFTEADGKAIRQQRTVADVGYLIRQQGQVEYGSGNWTTSIQGVSLSYPHITNWHVAVDQAI